MYKNIEITDVVFIDFETTGLDYKKCYPTEIAVYKESTGEEYNELIKIPEGVKISKFITDLTGITEGLLREEGKSKKEVGRELRRLISPTTMVVAHNVSFDLGYLYKNFGIEPNYFMCTMYGWMEEERDLSSSLQNVYQRNVGDVIQEHRAMTDVHMMYEVYKVLKDRNGNDLTKYINKVSQRRLNYVPKNSEIVSSPKQIKKTRNLG